MAFTQFIGKIGVRGQAKWSSGSWDSSPQHGWSGFWEGVYPWDDAYYQFVEGTNPATYRGEFMSSHSMIFIEGPFGAGASGQHIVRADVSTDGQLETMPIAQSIAQYDSPFYGEGERRSLSANFEIETKQAAIVNDQKH